MDVQGLKPWRFSGKEENMEREGGKHGEGRYKNVGAEMVGHIQ